VLGVGDRGRELGRYAERMLAETDRQVGQIPPSKRPTVYYARGSKGLETAARGSINVESLERLGARNVAEQLGSAGVSTVSPEQVLAWDPEIIIAIDPGFVTAVRTDPVWRGVRAVREGRVYLVPPAPFPWVDFPPSVNRLIGLRWLGRIFYPDQFAEDLRQETRIFYTMFYHQAPSEAQLDTLLAGVERPRS
jgi:iron complex transport system substrate-binding protein